MMSRLSATIAKQRNLASSASRKSESASGAAASSTLATIAFVLTFTGAGSTCAQRDEAARAPLKERDDQHQHEHLAERGGRAELEGGVEDADRDRGRD